jgi:hypothetical protein
MDKGYCGKKEIKKGVMMKELWVCIESTDEADADALKKRIEKHLKTLEHGDWSGRVIKVGQVI